MFQAGPEVHGDGAQLHLDGNEFLLVKKVHGNAYDNVQATIAVQLRIVDVIFDLDDLQVILFLQQLQQVVHVVDVRADHAHAGHVHDVALEVLQRGLFAVALQLLEYAGRLLYARLQMMDGVAVLLEIEILVEDLEAHHHLAHGSLVLLDDLAGFHLGVTKTLQIVQGAAQVVGQQKGKAAGPLASLRLDCKSTIGRLLRCVCHNEYSFKHGSTDPMIAEPSRQRRSGCRIPRNHQMRQAERAGGAPDPSTPAAPPPALRMARRSAIGACNRNDGSRKRP